MASSPKSVRELARAWLAAGLSVLAIRSDGTKAPAVEEWISLKEKRLPLTEVDFHFAEDSGIGIICGEVSRNLEVLDFDIPKYDDVAYGECNYDEWLEQLDVDLLELVESMPTVRTAGGGVHLYYRCSQISGNTKLAHKKANVPNVGIKYLTWNETRGRGGYVIAPGSPPECHPFGKDYELISGDFTKIPTITPEQRSLLFACCRSFEQKPAKQKSSYKFQDYQVPDGHRPGDDFNARASWNDILKPHGWTFSGNRRCDQAELWRRPGKKDRGFSATIRNINGQSLFHSFSSNSGALPHEESVTKFTAYTLLNHNGDFAAAARELGKEGYGEPARDPIDIDEVVNGKRGDDVPWMDCDPGIQTRFIEDTDFDGDIPDIPFHSIDSISYGIADQFVDPLDVQMDEYENRIKREERKRKKASKEEKRATDLEKGPAYHVWRNFGDEPEVIRTREGRIKVRPNQPIEGAWHTINAKFCHGLKRTLHYHNGEFMLWNGVRYEAMDADAIRPTVMRFMTHFAEQAGTDKNDEPIFVPYKVRAVRLDEMMKVIKCMTHIPSKTQDPCWLSNDEIVDPREIVCCTNGLVDIRNRKLLDPNPSYYSQTSTSIAYNKKAKKPKLWLKFLNTVLDPESQKLMQEWFGYCLVEDTRFQKMLMAVGKPGSGKGTAMYVLQELVGNDSVCAMDLDRVGDRFSLEIALGKSLMMFPDARQGHFNQKGSFIGNLLSITGEDAMMIDRKTVKAVTRKLNVRIVIVSNDILNIPDQSGALNRRLLWLKFPGHAEEEDPNLRKKLHEELSGILNWAIDGWHRLQKNRKFTQPKSARNFMEAFQEQASPIKSFIEDICDLDDDSFIKVGTLYKYWRGWRKLMGYQGSSSIIGFGRSLQSADMKIEKNRKVIDGRQTNVYVGVKINQEKLDSFINSAGDKEQWDQQKRQQAQEVLPNLIDMAKFRE